MMLHSVNGRARLALAMLVASTAPTLSAAQAVEVSGVLASASHRLLAGPLVGGRIATRRTTSASALSFSFGLDAVGGRSSRIDTVCGGLVLPGTCAPEPLRDRSLVIGADAGAALRLVGGPRAMLALNVDLMLAAVHATTRGRGGHNRVQSTEAMWGPRAGLTAEWTPTARAPIALQLGASAGLLEPIRGEWADDGYSPFSGDISHRRLHFGLVWRGRGSMQQR